MGSTVGDFDNDGDFDWFVTSISANEIWDQGTGNRLYRNLGNRTFRNDAVRSGVSDGGNNYLSQSERLVHFGLGQAPVDEIAEVEIRWPSGIVQTISGVLPNQILKVTEAVDQPVDLNILQFRDTGNQATFAAADNIAGINLAPGKFSISTLSNSGEQIALIDALGVDARRFTCNEKAPWPTSPDGDRYSIVLICPDANPGHTDPSNWRSSSAPGGTPGGSDSTTFTGDPNLN